MKETYFSRLLDAQKILSSKISLQSGFHTSWCIKATLNKISGCHNHLKDCFWPRACSVYGTMRYIKKIKIAIRNSIKLLFITFLYLSFNCPWSRSWIEIYFQSCLLTTKRPTCTYLVMEMKLSMLFLWNHPNDSSFSWYSLKSVHFKKTVALSSFLSKLW